MAIEIGTTEGALSGFCTSGEVICGAASDYYELPETLVFVDDSAEARFREEDRLLSHGSHVNGNAVEARDIEIVGKVLSDDEATQRTLLRTIAQKCARENVKLRYSSGFYINVARLRGIERKHRVMTGKKLTEVRLRFRATDPCWYGPSQQHVQSLAGNGTLTVTVDSSVFPDAVPVIQIQAPSVGSVGTLTLKNTSDGDRSCTYADTALRDGASVTLDSRDATATRGSTNTVRFFEGRWLRLVAGANVLSYTGGACTITITWQPRWL